MSVYVLAFLIGVIAGLRAHDGAGRGELGRPAGLDPFGKHGAGFYGLRRLRRGFSVCWRLAS